MEKGGTASEIEEKELIESILCVCDDEKIVGRGIFGSFWGCRV